MPFDGNGNFSLIYTWENDRIAGIPVEAGRMDTQEVDIASGLSNCVTRDGQSPASADLPMGGFKHTDVDDASSRNEYATLGQVQDDTYTWAGTATGTGNAIEITTNPIISSLVDGARFGFLASADNTGAVTLDVDMIGAENVYKQGDVPLIEGDISAGQLVEVRWDGTNFQLMTPNGYLSTTFATIGAYSEKTNAAGSVSGSLTINYNLGQHYSATLSGNVTSIAFSNWPAADPTAFMALKFKQAASGGPYTVAHPSAVKWIGSAPVMSTTASATDEYVYKSDNGFTTAQGIVVGQGWLNL